MITPQEISSFVNQLTPRKIPQNILRAVDNRHKLSRYATGFTIIVVLMVNLVILFWEKDILLNILSNRVHGSLINWEQIKTQRQYRVGISYPTPNGEVTANCYVDFKENIPGWGQIPESLNDQAQDDLVRLSVPFPVIVEYIKLFPSIARAVGTRSVDNPDVNNNSLVIHALSLLLILLYIIEGRTHLKMDKQLLTKGYFTTGLICEPKKQKLLIIVSVWFNDQHGKKQTGMCKVRTKRDKEKCRQLFKNDRPVGILYLPDRLEILITDLWLDD